MTDTLTGAVHALYLFDVAQAVDVAAVSRRFGTEAREARLTDKAPGPPRVRYLTPPVMIDGPAVGLHELDGFHVRVKFYDYGVVSLLLSRPFAGTWADLVRLGQDFIENEPLEEHALAACRRVVEQVRAALVEPRAAFLTEDYLAFVVTSTPAVGAAETLLDRHGVEIAQLLRGERQPLSRQEREDVLRNRLSYLEDDLVVPAWNAAFVYDTDAAAIAIIEVLELVNSQLLEFRYYDELLETELGRVYSELQRPSRGSRMLAWRSSRTARRLHALAIDLNELTDRLENSVKLWGDVYSGRLFTLAAARLGLDGWKRNVEEKLKTVDDIFRYAVEQAGMVQGNLMEMVIVLILVIELALLLAGVTK